jgi:hypothetical protein
MTYSKFVPHVIGQHMTGTMELDYLILWHRFGLAGIIAAVTAAMLLFLNDMIHKGNGSQQNPGPYC